MSVELGGFWDFFEVRFIIMYPFQESLFWASPEMLEAGTSVWDEICAFAQGHLDGREKQTVKCYFRAQASGCIAITVIMLEYKKARHFSWHPHFSPLPSSCWVVGMWKANRFTSNQLLSLHSCWFLLLKCFFSFSASVLNISKPCDQQFKLSQMCWLPPVILAPQVAEAGSCLRQKGSWM